MYQEEKIDVIRALSKPINLQILALLSSSPKYPRMLASILGKSEAFVVRSLKELEKYGLIESYWTRIGDRNVKMYKTRVRKLTLDFSYGNVKMVIDGKAERNIIVERVSDPVPMPKFFVDRRRELRALEKTVGVSLVWGPAGVGKTALAAKLAEKYVRKTLWYRCGEWTTVDDVMRRLALFLSSHGYNKLLEALESDAGMNAKALQAARGLDNLGCIVVLDDFHNVAIDDLTDFLYHIDPLLKKSKIIVLSRSPPNFIPEKGILLPLYALDKKSSRELLLKLGVTFREELFDWVYRATGGNPAMLIAIAKLAKLGLDPSKILVEDNLLDGIISRFINELTEYEYEVLKAASIFIEPATIGAISYVSGVKNARIYISSLERKGLLQVVDNSIYVHDIIRSFIERREKNGLWKYHILAARYYSDKESSEDHFKAFYHLVRGGDYEKALDKLDETSDKLLHIPSIHIKLYIKLLDEIPADLLKPRDKARLLFYKATREKEEKAIQLLGTVVKIAREEEDNILLMKAYQLLGEKYMYMGNKELALEYARKASEFIIVKNYWVDEYLLNQVIWLLHKLGEIRKALKLAKGYLERAQNPYSRAYANHWLGVLHEVLGDYGLAEKYLRESLNHYSETVSIKNMMVAYTDLAYVLYEQGRFSEALKYSELALEIASKTMDRERETTILVDRAEFYLARGDFEEAKRILNTIERKYIEEIEEDSWVRGMFLLAKARLLTAKGMVSNAIPYFEKASKILEKTHLFHYGRCLLYYSFAIANYDPSKACSLLVRAEQIFEQLGDKVDLNKATSLREIVCSKKGTI